MTPEFHPEARPELAAAVMSGASFGVTVGEKLRAETMRVCQRERQVIFARSAVCLCQFLG
jgi:hypothetical protein